MSSIRTREISKLEMEFNITRGKISFGIPRIFPLSWNPRISLSSSSVVVLSSLLFMTIKSTMFLFIVPFEGFLSLRKLQVMNAIYQRFPLWHTLSSLLLSFLLLVPTIASIAFLRGGSYRGNVSSLASLCGSCSLSYCLGLHHRCILQTTHS